LVTGGGSDIGAAIVAHRVERGDEVVYTASSAASLDAARTAFAARQVTAKGVIWDFAQPDASPELDAELAAGIDGVVLNAGGRLAKRRRLDVKPWAAVAKYVSDNVLGNLWLVHKLAGAMARRGFGRIVLISSQNVEGGAPGAAEYIAAKLALEGVIQNVAVDYAEHGVVANVVRPGLIETSRVEKVTGSAHYRERVTKLIPQLRFGTPADLLAPIDMFLGETCYANGAVLTVAGGLPMIRPKGVLVE
jgi:NAD(P)-dependent dehydrogenase (short-subunit alcohol dehydrogenase family)